MALTDKLTAIANAIRANTGDTEPLTLDEMTAAISQMSSACGLNFEVVGNPQPSNPKENTIWINTDTNITEWRIAKDNPYLIQQELTDVPIITGKYINEDEDKVASVNWNITDKILLPENAESITVTTQYQATTLVYNSFYDINDNFVCVVLRNADNPTYTIPSGARYFQASIRVTDTPQFFVTTNEAESGAVWITSDDKNSSIEFNALKTNGIHVYPLSAKQYVNGEWANVTSKSYHNNEWVEWLTYLLNRGKDNTNLTGGWQSIVKKYADDDDTTAAAPTVTQNAGSITLYQAKGFKYGIYATKNKISFANASRIKVVFSPLVENGASFSFGLWSSFGTYLKDNRVASCSTDDGDTVRYVEAPDSGSYYFGLMIGSSIDISITVTVRDIIVE